MQTETTTPILIHSTPSSGKPSSIPTSLETNSNPLGCAETFGNIPAETPPPPETKQQDKETAPTPPRTEEQETEQREIQRWSEFRDIKRRVTIAYTKLNAFHGTYRLHTWWESKWWSEREHQRDRYYWLYQFSSALEELKKSAVKLNEWIEKDLARTDIPKMEPEEVCAQPLRAIEASQPFYQAIRENKEKFVKRKRARGDILLPEYRPYETEIVSVSVETGARTVEYYNEAGQRIPQSQFTKEDKKGRSEEQEVPEQSVDHPTV